MSNAENKECGKCVEIELGLFSALMEGFRPDEQIGAIM